MYYLNRQQGEKFYVWARRVFQRMNEIRYENKDIISDFSMDTWIPTDEENYTDEVSLFKELYPKLFYFVVNNAFPRSIIIVQEFVNHIRDYEEFFAVNPDFYECPICDYDSTYNFFSDLCIWCAYEDNICKKCNKICVYPVNNLSDNLKL